MNRLLGMFATRWSGDSGEITNKKEKTQWNGQTALVMCVSV